MKAFPIANMEGNEEFLGMDLRDYFAAKAMSMVLNNEFWLCRHTFTTAYYEHIEICPSNEPEDFLAECAYALADAMIKAREK